MQDVSPCVTHTVHGQLENAWHMQCAMVQSVMGDLHG